MCRSWVSTTWNSDSDTGERALGDHSLYLKCTMTAASQWARRNKSLLVALPNPCFWRPESRLWGEV